MVLGYLFAGVVMERYDGFTLFRAAAVAAAVALVLYVLSLLMHKMEAKRAGPIDDGDAEPS